MKSEEFHLIREHKKYFIFLTVTMDLFQVVGVEVALVKIT